MVCSRVNFTFTYSLDILPNMEDALGKQDN